MGETWQCPSCLRVRRAAYCPTRGEERLRARDLTFADLATQLAKGATSIDGKLLRSFRSLLMTPGTLTKKYVAGERRRFLSPLALFFVANAAFVAVQALTGVNILSTPLDSHLHLQDWSSFAQQLVDARLQGSGQSLREYSRVFDESVAFNAKALMILMVLGIVPLAAAVFRSEQTTTGMHVVFALHLYAFILTLLCFAVLVAAAESAAGGDGLRSHVIDIALSLFNLIAAGLYIYVAIGVAYGAVGTSRIAKTACLTLFVAMLFLGYRFLIFLITIYTT